MNKTLNKILNLLKKGEFFFRLRKKLYPYFKGLILLFYPRKSGIEIVVPKYDVFDTKDIDLANKIFESYKKMKTDQNNINKIYKPSSMWQKHIDKDFKYLKDCLEANDLKKFLFFLQNFGNWKNYLGIENQNYIKSYSSNILLKRFLSEEIFNGQKKLWSYFNNEKDFSELNMPRYGNQNGALINGNFVVLGSFFNYIYSDIIKKYLDKKNKNIIADLGAGYGKLAYYILRNEKNYNFIDFDIPETLVLANFYLAKSFPGKKIFFYGEKNFDFNLVNEYDLLFLPNWEIEKINNNGVDITINKNSLGEMDPDAAHNYIYHIHRITKYFFSMNHEFFRNQFDEGKFSLVNKEFNISEKFKELIRYPDLAHLTYEENKINLKSDIFFYIYEKK